MGNLDNAVKANLAKLGVPSVAYVKAAGYTGTAGRNYRLIVLHDMEYPENGAGAEWCASFFAGGSVQASAHYMVDSNSVVQGVDIANVAWAAPGANSDGIQIEQAGFVSQDRNGWTDPYSTSERNLTAKLVASLCVALGIPPKRLSDAEIKAGAKGIVDHWAVNRVYGKSTHTDLGPNYPWDLLIPEVNHYVNAINGIEEFMAISAEDIIAIRDGVWNKVFTQDPFPQGAVAGDLLVGSRKVIGDVFNLIANLPAGVSDPAAIASAILAAFPADLAKDVADELHARLAA